MVVDDSVVMRRVLKSYFSQIGHSVVAEAGNGEQALVYYDAFKPDLVTLDITMPGADGIEILKQLITKNSELKVIIVSSITKKTTIIEALTNGAKHYILKPFTFDKIVSAVRGVFGEIEMNDVIKQAEEEVDIAIEEENAESVLNEVKNSIEAAKIFSKFIKIETTGSIGKENMDEYKKIISDVSSISPELITIDLCKVKNIEKEN
jgi:YesN/AraC family two-component response regulator